MKTTVQNPELHSEETIACQSQEDAACQHWHLQAKEPISALQLLADNTDLSKQYLKTCALKGAVWIQRTNNGKVERLRRLKTELKTGQQLDFYHNKTLLNQEPKAPKLVADFGNYSVWLKPRGMLSQGSKWADFTALYRWVEMNYQPDNNPRQCWIVHRLDRATSGLMLLAHSKKMASQLSHLFEENRIKKTYQAWVHGQLPQQKQTYNSDIDGKTAKSHALLLEYQTEYNISKIEVQIESGRKHQIRRHLSEAGFAIIGDRLYGSSELDEALNKALHKAMTQTLPSSLPKALDLQLSAVELCLPCNLNELVTETDNTSNEPCCFQLDNQQLELLDS